MIDQKPGGCTVVAVAAVVVVAGSVPGCCSCFGRVFLAPLHQYWRLQGHHRFAGLS